MTTAILERHQITTNGHRPVKSFARHTMTRLDHTNSAHRVLMCAVADRIPRFLSRLGSDNPAELIQRFIHSHWLMGSPTFAIWVAQAPTGAVVGHAIAQIDSAWGVPYVMLLQTELDRPYITTAAQRRALFTDMDVWAASQGATIMKTLTPRNPDVYPRHNGFTVDKVLMVRKVGQR